MTDLSGICMICMQKLNASGECPRCGGKTAPRQADDLLEVGSVLAGRFCVGRCTRRNAEGVTYLAYDLKADHPCSVREYYPAALCSRGEDGRLLPNTGREVTFGEGRSAFFEMWNTVLDCKWTDGMIYTYTIFAAHETCYAVFREQETATLRDRLLTTPGGTVDAPTAGRLFAPVLTALRALHGRGFVHGGVSPDSVIASADGSCVLSDFSIADVRREQNPYGAALHKGYAPIECYENGTLTSSADVYAAAGVLYRMLVGATPLDAQTRAQEDKLMIPARIAKTLPPDLIRALVSGMQLAPEDRAQTVDELLSALQDASSADAAADAVPSDKTAPAQAAAAAVSGLFAQTPAATAADAPEAEDLFAEVPGADLPEISASDDLFAQTAGPAAQEDSLSDGFFGEDAGEPALSSGEPAKADADLSAQPSTEDTPKSLDNAAGSIDAFSFFPSEGADVPPLENPVFGAPKPSEAPDKAIAEKPGADINSSLLDELTDLDDEFEEMSDEGTPSVSPEDDLFAQVYKDDADAFDRKIGLQQSTPVGEAAAGDAGAVRQNDPAPYPNESVAEYAARQAKAFAGDPLYKMPDPGDAAPQRAQAAPGYPQPGAYPPGYPPAGYMPGYPGQPVYAPGYVPMGYPMQPPYYPPYAPYPMGIYGQQGYPAGPYPQPGMNPAAAAEEKTEDEDGDALQSKRKLEPEEQEERAREWEKEERARAVLEQQRSRNKTNRRLKAVLVLMCLLFVVGIGIVVSALFGDNGATTPSYRTPEGESFIDADVPVPSFVGLNRDDVVIDSRYQSLFRFATNYESNADTEAGKVFQQSPEAGETVRAGTQIILYVSTGPDLSKIPDVTGKTFQEAAQILSAYGICKNSTKANDGTHTPNTVVETIPPAGTPYSEGTEITIIVWDNGGGAPTETGSDEQE